MYTITITFSDTRPFWKKLYESDRQALSIYEYATRDLTLSELEEFSKTFNALPDFLNNSLETEINFNYFDNTIYVSLSYSIIKALNARELFKNKSNVNITLSIEDVKKLIIYNITVDKYSFISSLDIDKLINIVKEKYIC